MAGELTLQLKNLGIEEPFSHEAEQAVLGAVIIDSSLLSDLIEMLTPEQFYNSQRGQIYAQMIQLFTQSQTIDIVTLINNIVENGIIANENDAKLYLASLAETVPSLSNVKAYASIILQKHSVRRLMAAATDILETASKESDPSVLLEFAEQKIYDLRQGRDSSALLHIETPITETLGYIQKISGPDRDRYLGIPTGFVYLDRMLGGLGKSDLVILAARPGVGKTSFALNIATNVAKRMQEAVAIFSLEMSREQLTARLLSSEALLDSSVFRSGIDRMELWKELADASSKMSKLPIYLDDSSAITVPEIKAKIRRINSDPRMPNVGFIIIDYLQLMTSGKKFDSRVNEVSEITRNLKIMAKELMVPVMTLSQLSRATEKRSKEEHRPVLADLRDSGSIEQDADSVLFLYREATYDDEADDTQAECIIAKNRHGEVGTAQLMWDGAHTRFLNPEYDY